MNSDTNIRMSPEAQKAIGEHLIALDQILTAMLGLQKESYHDAAVENIKNMQARVRGIQRLLPPEDAEYPF